MVVYGFKMGIGFKLDKNMVLFIGAVSVIIICGAAYYYISRPQPKERMIVSTTTSLYETGVLDVLKASFEESNPEYNVSFISQGTGLAIETAKRGDADMILVHSPSQEWGFMQDGFGVNRKIFAYNFFIIVGPESDPAGIKEMDPIDALLVIADEGVAGNAVWVSRGDNSGTHSKEKSMWVEAELDLEVLKKEALGDTGSPWYIEAGAGMTATLQLANQKDAYTLTDVATYLKNHKNGNIELVKIVDSGKDTLNVYSAIMVDPRRNADTRFSIAMNFIEFLVSNEVQKMLIDYGKEEFGSTLFKPWIPELSYPNTSIVEWVQEYAYFQGSECPIENRYQSHNLYP
jgi:tungstate transport system substrate-binding protein